jgi:hypothetical protein
MRRSLASWLLVSLATSTVARAEVEPGHPAPDFEAVTLAHRPLELSSLRGKVVLLVNGGFDAGDEAKLEEQLFAWVTR